MLHTILILHVQYSIVNIKGLLEFLIDNGEQVFRHVLSVWILILAACFYILMADAELIKNMNIKYSYEIWRRLFSDWAPAAIVMQNANILWAMPSKEMGGLTARRREMQNYFVVGLYAKNKCEVTVLRKSYRDVNLVLLRKYK